MLQEESNYNVLKELVETTYQNVIEVHHWFGEEIKHGKVLYDYDAEEYFKENTSLVLGFAHDKYHTVIEDDKWEEYSIGLDDLLEQVYRKIKEKAKEQLPCKIEFIEYTNFDDYQYNKIAK